MKKMSNIHKTAEVSKYAYIGKNTLIWNWVQIRERASIGHNCIISKGVYIDSDVKIWNNVKIQNNVSIFYGVTIEDSVFIGPHVCFTNDKFPRSININGILKNNNDWVVKKIRVCKGSSIGANCTILPGVTIGEKCVIGAGTTISKNIKDKTIVTQSKKSLIMTHYE